MDKILIGLITSNHKLALKHALINKIIENNGTKQHTDATDKNDTTLNLNEFIQKLENHWLLGPSSEISHDQFLAYSYQSLKEHSELIKKVFAYYLDDAKILKYNVEFNHETLLFHLNELFKNIFTSTVSEDDSELVSATTQHLFLCNKKNQLVLLFAWTAILIGSFQAFSLKFKLHAANFLQMININLASRTSSDSTDSALARRENYLYFMQNDAKFCCEYLSLVNSFDIVNLNSTFSINENSPADFSNKVNNFIENVLLETIFILIDSVSVRQKLYPSSVVNSYQNSHPESIMHILYAVNGLVDSCLRKSINLFEQSLKHLIQNLANTLPKSSDSNINLTAAHLFKCFDLSRANLVIKAFLYEEAITKNPKGLKEQAIRNLLLNMIYLLQWPFENIIDDWICSLMSLLVTQTQKIGLLLHVCEETCDYILGLIENAKTRRPALHVLSFFQINYQHSPKLFHKSCPKIVFLLENLKKLSDEEEAVEKEKSHVVAEEKNSIVKKNNSAKECYQQLALLSFVCITVFGGYPQIYKPILEIIQNKIDLSDFDSFKSRYIINSNVGKFASANPNDQSSIDNDSEEILILPTKFSFMTGLSNLGNTCYLNSMMQSLFGCKKFVKCILEMNMLDPTVSVSSLHNSSSFLIQMQILFATMHMTNRNVIKALNFVKFCTPSWFTLGQQQDTSEFLIFFLDHLNEQFKSLAANETLSQFASLIKNSFGIELTTYCECLSCQNQTNRRDISFCLPLILSNTTTSNNSKVSVQTLIDNFFHVETLSSENDNMYSCTNCQSLQKATKKILFTRDSYLNNQAPDFLIFTLNRFIYKQTATGGIENVKIMEQLDYAKEISINTYLNGELIVEEYELISIIVHSGSSIHHGHYYAYVKAKNTLNDTVWLMANDSQITSSTYESLISNLELFKNDTPYVLFYQKFNEKTPSQKNIMNLDITNVVNKRLVEFLEQDNRLFDLEEKKRILSKSNNLKRKSQFSWASNNTNFNSNYKFEKKDDDNEDENQGNHKPSNLDSGPRIIF